MNDRYPFTDEEAAILTGAYAALTRIGQATAAPPDPDGYPRWDEHIDRAHHGLAIVLVYAGLPPDQPPPWPEEDPDPPPWPEEPAPRPVATVYLPGDHPRTHRPPSA